MIIIQYMKEYQDRQIVSCLINKIEEMKIDEKIKIMEVCGTHTASIFKYGIKSLLPDNVELIAGPGCPVCVTPESYIDKAVSLTRQEKVIITTFADLMRVTGRKSSLQQEKSSGGDIRIVLSPLKAVDIAVENPEAKVIFLAVGFETTIPAIALSVKKAERMKLRNFYLLQSMKLMPPVLRQLLLDEEVKIDAFLLPGHVSTITGIEIFDFISKIYDIPAAAAGFEPVDILFAIYRLLKMREKNEIRVENLYSRAVSRQGNDLAHTVMDEVFKKKDSCWRGLGVIDSSGLTLNEQFINYDAETHFYFKQKSNEGRRLSKFCICGEILSGTKKPVDCCLYAVTCNPIHPVGPCMVSREGTCAAYYHYHGKNTKKEDDFKKTEVK